MQQRRSLIRTAKLLQQTFCSVEIPWVGSPNTTFVGRDWLSEDQDSTQLYIQAQQHFLQADFGLPAHVKELLLTHQWDRLLVDIRRTVKVTKSVKLEKYHALVCVGNFKGLFGVGQADAREVHHVLGNALVNAFQNLVSVPLYRGHTIYHPVEHTFHKVKVLLMPRPQGWGIKANDLMYQLCNMVGMQDISVKVMGRRGRRNKFTVVKAFQQAVQQQSAPHDGVEAMAMYSREVFLRRHLPQGLKRGVDVP